MATFCRNCGKRVIRKNFDDVNKPILGDYETNHTKINYDRRFLLIVSDYYEIWNDPRRFKSLLLDLYPQEKYLRNLIFLSSEENIPHELSTMQKCEDVDFRRLVKRFTSAYPYPEEDAEKIVNMWIEYLGITR